EAGALGRARSNCPLPRRPTVTRALPSHRATTRHQQSAHRNRPPAHDPRLLRLTRRRDPLPRAADRRVKLGHDPKRLGIGMTATRWRRRLTDGVLAGRGPTAPCTQRGANRCLATEPPTQQDPLVRNLATPTEPPHNFTDHARAKHLDTPHSFTDADRRTPVR